MRTESRFFGGRTIRRRISLDGRDSGAYAGRGGIVQEQKKADLVRAAESLADSVAQRSIHRSARKI